MAEVRTTHSGEPDVRAVNNDVDERSTARPAADPKINRSVLVFVALGAIATAGTARHPDITIAAPLIVIATIPAVLVDVVERRLPNTLVAAAGLVAAVLIAASALLAREPDVIGAAIGAASMAVPLLAVHLVSPRSMGFGDVKLAIVLGTALGLVSPLLSLVALAIACATAAAIGIARRQRTVAFGPALALGAAASLLIVASPINLPELTGIDAIEDSMP